MYYFSDAGSGDTPKKALIIGINGQIGSYLCDVLCAKNYDIYSYGRTPATNTKVKSFVGNLIDIANLEDVIKKIEPDEIYNFGAVSDAVVSVQKPEETMLINANSVITLCRIVQSMKKKVKLFLASSAEIYKGINDKFIDERAITMYPKNPYAISKIAAYWTGRYYREQQNCFVCNGIIFNAESPRRNVNFVTRKITTELQEISRNGEHVMTIGNMTSQRDWIHAHDVATAAWLMMQQEIADDYMICLSQNHTVKEFIEITAAQLKISLNWKYNGLDEIGINEKERTIIKIDPKYFRNYETNIQSILGDNGKLKSIGWEPQYNLSQIIADMLSC